MGLDLTAEEIIDNLIEAGNKFYKKNFRKYCPTVAGYLDRKKSVIINGQEYRCWNELVIHNIGILIQDYIPNSQCEVCLDMNDSQLIVDGLTPDDEKTILEKLNDLSLENKLGATHK